MSEHFKDWQLDHWAYLNSKPTCSAIFKQYPQDFIVTETLSFTPTGEGENLLLLIEKVQLNTQQVCEYLAKFFNKRLRDIGYAGLKDKQSISRQWFSIQVNRNDELDFANFGNEQIQLINSVRHQRKLRVGALKDNHFSITLRKVTDTAALLAALKEVKQNGVPNYFGLQRFGFKGNNLNWANRMAAGEVLKNKKLKGFALSASRSYLFNEYLSQKLATSSITTVSEGEVYMLSGSNSFFSDQDLTTMQGRIDSGDIGLSGPLFGAGESTATDQVAEVEQQIQNQHPKWLNMLVENKVDFDRRRLHLKPQNLQWSIEGDAVKIEFNLPTGSFATAVLRECVELIEEQHEHINQ